MIRLENIHIFFNPGTVMKKHALKGIDLAIDEKEFIIVIGSNGAGKSTLLNAIAGESLPSCGSMNMDGEDVTNLPSFKRSHLVARVFQDPLAGTCSDLTIAENLSLAENRGKSRIFGWCLTKIKKEKYRFLLSKLRLGLENRLDTCMGLLSGGQRQAVSLLMATLSPLKILLLDEHTSALDPKTAAFIMKLTQQIIEEKKLTAIMITHSLTQALQYGSRTIMLHEGKIIYDISKEERKYVTIDDLLEQFGHYHVDDDRLFLQ